MSKSDSYLSTAVGHANRHRLIALFVCVPAALALLHASTRDEVTTAETVKTLVFVVAAYSSGAAAVRAWPSQRKLALAGVQMGRAQVWLFRGLSVACALLALFAALLAWVVVRNA